jgi:hypothetical protein
MNVALWLICAFKKFESVVYGVQCSSVVRGTKETVGSRKRHRCVVACPQQSSIHLSVRKLKIYLFHDWMDINTTQTNKITCPLIVPPYESIIVPLHKIRNSKEG